MADLLLNKFGTGWSESALTGYGEMRNVDIYSTPGVLKINNKMQLSSQQPIAGLAFTADPVTDLLTFAAPHNLRDGAVITVTSTGTLPAPLMTATTYYVLFVSPTTIRLASSFANWFAGTFIDITTAGTGTHTLTTINLGRIRHFTEDPRTNTLYCVDDNGRVWTLNTSGGGTWVLIEGNSRTGAAGNGIAVWKNYLFVFRNAAIDVYGNLSAAVAARTWTNNWQALTSGAGSGNSHHALWSVNDDILYWVDDRNVGSLNELTTFDPAVAGTYTFNSGALILPRFYIGYRLEELGTNLMVSANIGSNGFTTTIFPWDHVSTTFNLPLKLPWQMDSFITYNNTLYLISSRMNRIYASNGSYITELKRLPPNAFSSNSSGSVGAVANGMFNGRMFFTLFGQNTYAGIQSLNLSGGAYNATNALVFENYISTGSTSQQVSVLGFHSPRTQGTFYVSWYDGSLGYGGIDSYFGNSGGTLVKYSNFESYWESPLVKVGNTLTKANYSQVEIALAAPLLGGQSIRLSYRSNISSTYTMIGTFTVNDVFTPNKSSANFEYSLNDNVVDIRGIEYVQVKCELSSDSSGLSTMQLLEIRLRE